jgi:hypothetical protein
VNFGFGDCVIFIALRPKCSPGRTGTSLRRPAFPAMEREPGKWTERVEGGGSSMGIRKRGPQPAYS